MADIPQNVENVRNLLNHPAFDLRNPNKVSDLPLLYMRTSMHVQTSAHQIIELGISP